MAANNGFGQYKNKETAPLFRFVQFQDAANSVIVSRHVGKDDFNVFRRDVDAFTDGIGDLADEGAFLLDGTTFDQVNLHDGHWGCLSLSFFDGVQNDRSQDIFKRPDPSAATSRG